MKNKTSGFTLIELMIAVIVAGIGILAVSWILLLNQSSWKEGNAKLELQRDTYLAMLKIEHELRPARSSDMDMIISSPPHPLLTINYTTNDEKFRLSFSKEGNGDLLFRKYIYNTDTTEWDKVEELVMAKEITDANFGDSSISPISPTSKLVTINFTLKSGNLESFITTSVMPRN